jgi:hypothetical protein
MRWYGKSGGIAPRILNLGTSGQFHDPPTPSSESKSSNTHLILEWLGPRTGLDAVNKRKL